jgi:PPK2 family polyphosphate:nucleotide phosphotransferase
MDLSDDIIERFCVTPGTKVRLDRWPAKWYPPRGLEELNKDALKQEAAEFVAHRVQELAGLQELLWADGRYAVLLILQGPDASGKDSMIKHVLSGMNPSGVRVVSFKEPSAGELRHNYLWRYVTALPEHGMIGVFNRSYYEEVGIVRVRPELLKARPMPERKIDASFWAERYEDINYVEQHLVRNGTVVLKFFMHISKEEQKKEILERLETPEKHWKFSPSDLTERDLWDDYQRAYEAMLTHTSTAHAPWWIMPADRKWATRTIVAEVIAMEMRKLDLRYPPPDDEKQRLIEDSLNKLKSETDN